MSTSLKFSKDLFVAQDGTPMNFNLTRCENVQVLQEYIEHGGGLVQQSLGPYTVILKDAAQDLSTVREESFQSDFIIQCCSQNKILPLAQFRCSSTSLFSADFNPNDILHHKISWQSAEKHHKKTSDDSESEKSISVDETRHALTRANGPKVMSKKRTEFTQLDRKKIVEYIVRTKSHNQVTGNDLWKRMEPEINHHTWQSLKGHFMKKIIPLIGTYNLSKDEINKFRSGMSTSSGSGMQHNSNWKKNIPYSSDEDNLILDYVSRHANSKTCLGGNEFWKEMQNNNNYINGRPWKGVRERYLKHLQHRKPSDETISECAEETAAESNIVESVPASSEGRNGEGTSMKPSSWQKRKLVTAVCQSPAEFSPTSGKRTGSFLVKKKFNNTEDKNFRKLIVFSDDEDDEGINSNLNPSGPSLQDSLRHPQSKEIFTDEQIAPPPSVGTLEDEGVNRGVDPLSPAPICQQFIPSKLSGEADEGSCSAKSRSPHPESDSEWPSNFPPERVILYSAISEVPLSDSDTREDETSVTSDSDWSDNGLFWRGGVEFPDGMKVKRHPFAHLTAVKCNEGHQGRKGKPLEARSEEQYGTDNGDLSETEVQDYLEAKKRACPEVTSTNYEALASGTSRGAEVQSNFSEPIDMESQDFSQQISHPGLQGTHREEPPVINTCEKTVNEDSRKVGVRVTLDNKKDVGVTVAVQTDPVLVLPIGWRSLISTSNGGLPSLSSNLPTTLHDYCVSPKPANII